MSAVSQKNIVPALGKVMGPVPGTDRPHVFTEVNVELSSSVASRTKGVAGSGCARQELAELWRCETIEVELDREYFTGRRDAGGVPARCVALERLPEVLEQRLLEAARRGRGSDVARAFVLMLLVKQVATRVDAVYFGAQPSSGRRAL